MKNFESKLIAYIFGIQEPIDEHAYAILGRAAIHAVLGILTFELTINVMSFLIPFHSYEDAFYIMSSIQLTGIFLILIATTTLAISKNGLGKEEVTADAYPAALKRARRKAFLSSIVSTAIFHLLGAILSLREQGFLTSLADKHRLIQTAIFFVFFTAMILFAVKRNLKIISNDD